MFVIIYERREGFRSNIKKCNQIYRKEDCNNKCVWCKKSGKCTDISLFNRSFCEDNIKKNIYKVPDKIVKSKLKGYTHILEKGCFDRCPKKECEKLYSYINSAKECLKCHQNKKNCYHKKMVGGYCSPCDKNEEQVSCLNVNRFGCPNPNDLNNMNGVMPYYYQVKTNSVNSAYDTECRFCWNLK